MPATLVLAPAVAGKTHACIVKVRSTLSRTPLADVWVLLPNRAQAHAFRRRLAEAGGALGARVGTFGDLNRTLLALAGRTQPVAPEPVIYRLTLSAIDSVADRGQLLHYGAIRRRPGFIRAVMDLMAELKRAHVEPVEFSAAVADRDRRLLELALVYDEYESALAALDWTDPEGLGWLAVEELEARKELAAGWHLVAADGFDSFTQVQLQTLKLLGERVQELRLTLTGAPGMPRKAYRRYERTLERLCNSMSIRTEALEPHRNPIAPLAHLEACLFEAPPRRVPAEGRVTLVQAQTPEIEVREALRWIKARIIRDGIPADRCALVARDLSGYQPFLRQAGREFGLPLSFSVGESLASNPAVAAIMNLIALAPNRYARRPLLDALRTPYLNLARFGLERRDEVACKQAAYWGQVIGGRDQWQEVFARLAERTADRTGDAADDEAAPPAELPSGQAAARLWNGLDAFMARVVPPDKASLFEHVKWLEELCSADKGVGVAECVAAQADTAPRDQAALAEFNDVLRSLVLSERIVGVRPEMPHPDFLQELRGAVDAAEYPPDESQPAFEGSVQVGHLGAVRGVEYRAVALLGLSEGLFPAALEEDPFLSDDERGALDARGLRLDPRLRSDQQTLFYEAVTRASDYLFLSRPYLAPDGERWVASPYWNEILGLVDVQPIVVRAGEPRPLSEAGSVVELLTAAVARRALPRKFDRLEPDWQSLKRAARVLEARIARTAGGEFEGRLADLAPVLSERYSEVHVWSASRIETYAACPFRFLISSALDLEPRETPEAGFDPAQLGGMLHLILEQVYKNAADPADVEDIVSKLPAVACDVFAAAPRKWGFRPTCLWQAEQAELIAKLEATLRNLAAVAEGFRPSAYEQPFGFRRATPLIVKSCAGNLVFHGVIDRVDTNGDAIRIVDYKTGASHLDASSLGEGKRLQLALYALAAQETLGLGRVVDGFYWAILKGEAGSLRLGRFAYATPDKREFIGVQGAIELTREYVGQVVGAIRSGLFIPQPPRDDCPSYCAAKTICWRYTPAEMR